jgi:hypothetical protein
MSRQEQIRASIKSLSQFDDTPEGQQRRWMAEISTAEKKWGPYKKQARATYKKYLDLDRTATDGLNNMNVFNTNTNMLMNMLYARPPEPDVSRRNVDPNDAIGRVASLILGRAMKYDYSLDEMYETLRNAVTDYLVVGLGVTWQRYDLTTELDPQLTDDIDEFGNLVEPDPIVTDEQTPTEYVNWDDFLVGPCRTWSEAQWVARRTFLPYDALKARFGEEIADSIGFGEDKDSNDGQLLMEAEVWEIWNKLDKKVYWLCKSAPQLLDERDDFLKLPKFFPCPKPLIANTSTHSFVPKPDYVLHQDQYNMLNQLNNRASKLIGLIRASGVYNGKIPELQQLLDSNNGDGLMIAAAKWEQNLADKGVQSQVQFAPIAEYASVLSQVLQARAGVMHDIEVLTGISDIQQSMAKPYVTSTAEQMKGSATIQRIVDKHRAIGEFVSGVLELKAHLMCSHYEPQRLMDRCGQLYDEDMRYVPQAIQLLKDAGAREFRIQVRADSMAIANKTANRQAATDFLMGVSQFVNQGLVAAKEHPEVARMLLESFRLTANTFPENDGLLGVIDEEVRNLQKMAQQQRDNPQPPKPSPEEVRMQMEQQKMQHEMQQDQAKAQREQQDAQNKMATDAQKADAEAKVELIKAQAEKERADQEHQIALMKLELERQRLVLEEKKLVLDAKLKAGAALPAPGQVLNTDDKLEDYVDMNGMTQEVQGVMAEEHARHVTPEFVNNMLQQMDARMSQMATLIQNQNAQMAANLEHAINTAVSTPLPEQTFKFTKDLDGNISGTIQ